MTCCGGDPNFEANEAEEAAHASPDLAKSPSNGKGKSNTPSSPSAAINIHPWDSTINLSVHQPLYPPGKIIHIVRQYPSRNAKDSG